MAAPESDASRDTSATPPQKPNARDAVREAERMESLRDRLYARGATPEVRERHTFARPQAQLQEVRAQGKGRDASFSPAVVTRATPAHTMQPVTDRTPSETATSMPIKKKTHRYRLWIVFIGVAFFVASLGIASVLLLFSNNTVGGNNISIDVKGPLTVGGGEDMSLQIAIANQNDVAIESAMLIIEYPKGTQSVEEIGKEVFTEREQLHNIASGEVVNVPVKVRIFGEENEEKTIHVAVEYRVAGSNATFQKEAAPLNFKVSTSPVVVTTKGIKSISSGQEMDLSFEIQSNSPSTLTNLLVKARYPDDFDVVSVKPETIAGRDTWSIKSLKPGEKQTVTVRGIITGDENTSKAFDVIVGVPNERDPFNVVSQLAVVTHEVRIERPFLDVTVSVNTKKDDTVVIDTKGNALVEIGFKNTLESALYNGVVKVVLEGNALSEMDIQVPDGYYDSKENTIVWDSVGMSVLKDLAPGESGRVAFTLLPLKDIRETPEMKLTVSFEAERVFEDSASERVKGTASRTIKVETITKVASSVLYSDGPFVNSGPIPPVAEETTQYTYLLSVANGTNPISGAEVTAVLPPFVTWLDLVSEDDRVSYNGTTRTIKWSIGDVAANGYEEMWAQVSFTPSLTQINSSPTILQTQRFKATDNFTGTTLRDEAAALTTELFNDPDPTTHDGRVRRDD